MNKHNESRPFLDALESEIAKGLPTTKAYQMVLEYLDGRDQERSELLAQLERLRGVLGNSYSALDNYCPELSELIDEVGSALTETPAQSLEAVKREWKESIDSAIEGFAFTTSEGQWVVHRDDVSGLLSK